MPIYTNKYSVLDQKMPNNKPNTNTQSSIAIIGAGWLGMPLAEHLSTQNWNIQLTKTTPEDVANLAQEGWQICQYQLGDSLPPSLHYSDIAFLNIPPRRKHFTPEKFVTNMCKLIDQLAQNGINKVLMISTTSVYGELSGDIVDTHCVAPNTESGKAHVIIEQHLRATFLEHATIIRPAGLIGGKRHPINTLAGRTELTSPNNVVNLIHRDDLINIITAIINQAFWGKTCHLAAPDHPQRKDYYPWCAEQLQLTKPTFISNENSTENTGKVINSQSLLEELSVNLRYPSPYDMLPNKTT